MITESKEEYTAYIVRHGESEFNIQQMKAHNSEVEIKDNENFEVKFCKELIDCPLSSRGVEQSLECGKTVEKLNIAYVLVSPLRRALMTCENIFKNHPNPPKVFVHPGLRERMQSNCDIGSGMDELQKEFPKYDFSLLSSFDKPHFWYIYGLPKEAQDQLFKEIVERHPTLEEEKSNGKYVALEKIKGLFPIRIETQEYLNERVKETRKDIRKRVDEAKNQGKVLMIGHSRFWESLTAESFTADGEPIGAKWLKNCEVCEIKLKTD